MSNRLTWGFVFLFCQPVWFLAFCEMLGDEAYCEYRSMPPWLKAACLVLMLLDLVIDVTKLLR